MPIGAVELFEHFSREERGVASFVTQSRIQVVGKVVKGSLRNDKVACVTLAADAQGIATVECRCVSDEVLLLVKVGAAATLEGVCAGMEDSVTLGMERCDLIDVQVPAPVVWRGPPNQRPSRQDPLLK